jgi:hypothetical protein
MLNRHNLTIAKLAEKDPGRYTLNRIEVRPDRTCVTNGHYAVTVTTPDMKVESFPDMPGAPKAADDFKPFTIAADSALKAVKNHPTGNRKTTLPILACTAVAMTAEGNPALLATDVEQLAVTEVKDSKGCTFPDVDRCIPSLDKATFSMDLDAKYLLSLLQAVADFKGKANRAPVVSLHICENGGRTFNLAAVNDEGQTFRAVLMPTRGSADYEKQWEAAQTAKREAETAAYEAEHKAAEVAPAELETVNAA